MAETLTLGYSPCPNDTFIFYALVHGKIQTNGIVFRERLEDVENLNRMAKQAMLDITKVSFHAFGHLRDSYCMLRSGGALGRGCGPLVVSREDYDMKDLKKRIIAIPGELTTAFLLLQIFDPELKHRTRIMPFDKIMSAVKDGEADAGLIIHESRFTYKEYGLKEIIDLGSWWENETGLPIPLGCIIAKRDLGRELVSKTDAFIKESIGYAFRNRSEAKEYITAHAQELETAVIEQHIQLYVNDYSVDIGADGIHAAETLYEMAAERDIIPRSSLPVFL